MTPGLLHLFEGTDGTLLQTFHNPTPGEEDRLRNEKAFLGDNILVSAPGDDFGGIDGCGCGLFVQQQFGQLTRCIRFANPDPTTTLRGKFRSRSLVA